MSVGMRGAVDDIGAVDQGAVGGRRRFASRGEFELEKAAGELVVPVLKHDHAVGGVWDLLVQPLVF